MTKRVLMVEDDEPLAAMTREFLENHGLHVDLNLTGAGVVAAVSTGGYDAIVLDVALPAASGLDLCRQLRPRFPGPLLLYTASAGEPDEMRGLDAGADYYLTKPVHPRRLLLTLRAAFRLADRVGTTYDDGTLYVDFDARQATVGGAELDLTTLEFDILWFLVQRAGRPATREAFYDEVRGAPYDGIDRSLDVGIVRLRRKLTRAGLSSSRIVTVRGVGYQLSVG